MCFYLLPWYCYWQMKGSSTGKDSRATSRLHWQTWWSSKRTPGAEASYKMNSQTRMQNSPSNMPYFRNSRRTYSLWTSTAGVGQERRVMRTGLSLHWRLAFECTFKRCVGIFCLVCCASFHHRSSSPSLATLHLWLPSPSLTAIHLVLLFYLLPPSVSYFRLSLSAVCVS
jgi:hypothetical protein